MLEHSLAATPSQTVYGFALYLCCYLTFAEYFIWAIIPDSLLHGTWVLATNIRLLMY
jgi:hypothetical protein